MLLLLMRLEGPLQSWGERSSWDTRDTALMPTKSAVIGLLSCCMGLSRDDCRIRELSEQLHVAVRADRPGIVMTDYQTVQGMPTIYDTSGKPRNSGNIILTPRDYLQDASFLVAVYGNEHLLKECAEKMKAPVWPPYLGRKNCVPSCPIIPVLTQEFQSVEEAFSMIELPNGNDRTVEAEYEDSNGNTIRYDKVTDFRNRVFETRLVRRESVHVKGGKHVPDAS